MTMVETRGIEIEPSVSLPGDGRDVYYYPNPHLMGGHADKVARITARSGRTWYAATSDKPFSVTPDVFVMPGGQLVFVRGWIVDAEQPMHWEKVPLESIREYRMSPDGKIAIFRDHCAAAGYTHKGLHWLTRLDYLCMLKFTDIDNRQVGVNAEMDEDLVGEAPIALGIWHGNAIFARKA
jgi:hypothetical protein